MAQVNIFGNIDATGILKDYKTQIDNYYGGDPTLNPPPANVKTKIVDPNFPPFKIGYWESSALPSYTRLISSKDSTVGYEIRPGDTTALNGKTYLTNTYNLTITAQNGDNLRWWGHTIVPNISTQAIISSINLPGSSTAPPPQFTNMKNTNISFFNTGSAVNPANLMDGLNIETHSAFCIDATLNGTVGQTINYDIDVMIMSAAIIAPNGSLVTYPIIQVVVDPVLIING